MAGGFVEIVFEIVRGDGKSSSGERRGAARQSQEDCAASNKAAGVHHGVNVSGIDGPKSKSYRRQARIAEIAMAFESWQFGN